jgi:hypothetical protein
MKILLLAAMAISQYLSVSGLAWAQCAPGDQVLIDPRLVRHRPQLSQEQIRDIMSNPAISEQTKLGFLQQYQQQGQPIQMPLNNGYVLISPLNPCIQQFVPLR